MRRKRSFGVAENMFVSGTRDAQSPSSRPWLDLGGNLCAPVANDTCLSFAPGTDCHVIAVKPEHQRRGAGALLTKWGLDMAELAGLPVYLESSEEGFGLYKRLGFEVLEEKIVHRAGLVGTENDVAVPLMVKMPSIAKGLTFEQWRAQGYPPFE